MFTDNFSDAILMKRREALSELYDLIEGKIERYRGPGFGADVQMTQK